MSWIAVIVLCACLAIAIFRWCLPGVRLARACRLIASGTGKPPFVPRGAQILGRATLDLEKIYQRLQAQQAELDAARERSEAVAGHMCEAVLVADAQGKILFSNEAAQVLLREPGGAHGKPLSKAVRFQEAHEAFVECWRERREVRRDAMLFNHSGAGVGRQFFELRAFPQERSGTVLIMVRDLTEIRQMESVQREFIANTSHELRTPLAIFQGYLETLLDSPDAGWEEVEKTLLKMRRHSQRLNSLVRDLLEISRMDAGRITMKKAPVSLGHLCARIAGDYAVHPVAEGRALRVDAPETLPQILADPERVEQVLCNLIDNACTYSPAGTPIEIRVSLSEDGRECICRVTDSGPGIAAADLPRLFERFYRAASSRGREHRGGAGLGLSIAQGIVEAHGGRIWAENARGYGAVFSFALPVRGVSTPGPDAATP